MSAKFTDDELKQEHQKLVAEAYALNEQLKELRDAYRALEKEIWNRPNLRGYASKHIG